ncbi:MAG: T9SS type A sorting domain-containing protein [Bacteroidales bacterium]
MKTSIVVLALMLMTFTQVQSQNHPPVAVSDTVYGFIGYPVYVNLLKNDYDPDGDSIHVYASPYLTKINDSIWEYHVLTSLYYYLQKTSYFIIDEHDSSAHANFTFIPKSPPRYDSLDINNINALVSPFGNHFWDDNPNPFLNSSRFEVPKSSGKTAVFNQTLWIGGLDNIDTLHFAGERYRQGLYGSSPGTGFDYSTGPISSVYDTSYQLKWNRVWKLKKSDILYHKNNWNTPGYIPIDAIANWPAHGNTTQGQMPDIAPFNDINADGIYNPESGEYPLIRGDEAVFFVFNDSAGLHTETRGLKLGIEIHGMAYAFDQPDDSVLNNTIFFHYDIINRSPKAYHDVYMGLFTDFDLGFADDDYIGCDVKNGSIYAYNGDSIDGNGQSWAYGEHPPVIAMKIIGGPFLDPDNLDNPLGGCDYGINGLNFENGIVDDERYGLQGFMYPHFWGASYDENLYAIDYYKEMQGIWNDGTRMVFGGLGHVPPGDTGLSCRYMYPGGSDTICNWGTSGVLPGGGWNQNGLYWTELAVGNPPEDRRGVASVGPFNMLAGQSVPLDYCFNYSRDYTGNQQSSLELMQNNLSALNPIYDSLIMLPETINGIKEYEHLKQLRIYPNPARVSLTVVSGENKSNSFQVFDLNGKLYFSGLLNPGKNVINISSLKPDVYLLKSNNRCARIIVM